MIIALKGLHSAGDMKFSSNLVKFPNTKCIPEMTASMLE